MADNPVPDAVEHLSLVVDSIRERLVEMMGLCPNCVDALINDAFIYADTELMAMRMAREEQ